MKLKYLILGGFVTVGTFSCTKLDQKLQNSFTANPSSTGAVDVNALLNATYNDLTGLMHSQDQIFSLEQNTSDETLVPTRGGDWDDNGVWRVLHSHSWTAIHGQTISVFNNLGQLESDAITTLAYNPSQQQAAEAMFLRSVAQFYLLDLYGQVPYREVAKYNSIDPAPVYQPADAVKNLVSTLTSIIPQLPASNAPYKASPDAARFLLMKVLLNKGAFINRAAPTFDPADMAQVISLGNQIINSGNYSLSTEYFDNFSPFNSSRSTERIWAWHNTGASQAPDGINSGGINARWMMTLHYNSWDKNNSYGGAGWNGFSTVADFYNTFEGHGDGTPNTVIDTTKDSRLGGRYYAGVTDQSGLRPCLLAGQQYNENGVAEVDRHGNALKFSPNVSLVETDPNTLEIDGIRIVKYAPDYSAYSGGQQRNQLQIFRYADVLLMVAEAKLRSGDAAGALLLVNQLRLARNASPIVSLTTDILLAERGRELYWESWRRQDLIRFGVYLKPWALKPTDDPKYLLFPIPSSQLIANPNLKQNPGY